MLKVNADNGYKAVERVYSGSTEIDKILDKNGNVLFAVNKEVEGTPALTYTGKEETNLKNYRIYGNTVDGESVGDRSGNLWNEIYDEDGNLHYVPIKVEDGEYTLSTTTPNVEVPGGPPVATIFLLAGNVNTGASTTGNGCWLNNPKTVQSIDGYVTIAYDATEFVSEQCYPWNNNTMLNSGSTALPYEPYVCEVPVTITNGADTQTRNLYLPEPIKMVGDEAEYIDYREQKMHKVRKNLFPVVATSKTVNGVAFTVNADKSVTCNGTNNGTSGAIFEFNPSGVSLEIGESYIVTGCPEGGAIGRSYVIQYNNGSSWSYETGHGATFTALGTGIARHRIIISTGVTVNNLTFYPMIRKADIEDDTYEPYIEDTELDVAIPSLPTLSGTNTLSVGTKVQPSNVYLKGRIKAISV